MKVTIKIFYPFTLINIMLNFRKTQASQSEPDSAEDIVDSIISDPSALEPVHDLSEGMPTSYFITFISIYILKKIYHFRYIYASCKRPI